MSALRSTSRPRALAALLLALPLLSARAGAPPAREAAYLPPSLHLRQPVEARAVVEHSGRFHTLYRAIQDDPESHVVERLGIRLLLGEPEAGLDCTRVRQRTSELGGTPAARRQALVELDDWFQTEVERPDFVERHVSYAFLGSVGEEDPDFLLYTTPHRSVARQYGEVLFHLRQVAPRGAYVQGWSQTHARRRRLGLFRRLSARNFNPYDLDEYIIPSHVEAEDVVTVEILRRNPRMWPGARMRIPGESIRSYVRVKRGADHWIHVRSHDGRDRGSLGLEGAPPPPPQAARAGRPLHASLVRWLESIQVAGRRVRYHPPR